MLDSSVKLFLTLVSLYLQCSAWCVHSSRRQSANHIVSKILNLPLIQSPQLYGEGGCGSRYESCALCRQPRLSSWHLRRVQKWCTSSKGLSNVSPDHELRGDDPPQLFETAHNSYNYSILIRTIVVPRLKYLMKCLWLPNNFFACVSGNT